MAIAVGEKIPSATLKHMTDDGPADITTDELFGGKKVVVFAVPGAFTPTCSVKHLPGFVQHADDGAGDGRGEVDAGIVHPMAERAVHQETEQAVEDEVHRLDRGALQEDRVEDVGGGDGQKPSELDRADPGPAKLRDRHQHGGQHDDADDRVGVDLRPGILGDDVANGAGQGHEGEDQHRPEQNGRPGNPFLFPRRSVQHGGQRRPDVEPGSADKLHLRKGIERRSGCSETTL